MRASKIALLFGFIFITGCSDDQPPRDVADVSSDNTTTLMAPVISKASKDEIIVRYAQVSMGFDAGCNPFKSFSSEKNQCAKLPESVKKIASEHCANYSKKAVFYGNKTNLIKMTLSRFKCE